jgi:hypothetical protein
VYSIRPKLCLDMSVVKEKEKKLGVCLFVEKILFVVTCLCRAMCENSFCI